MPMKPPTCPLASPSTVIGALTAQRVLTYPFVMENRIRLRMINQSEEKIPAGGTSNEIRRHVTRKRVLKMERILVVQFDRIRP